MRRSLYNGLSLVILKNRLKTAFSFLERRCVVICYFLIWVAQSILFLLLVFATIFSVWRHIHLCSVTFWTKSSPSCFSLAFYLFVLDTIVGLIVLSSAVEFLLHKHQLSTIAIMTDKLPARPETICRSWNSTSPSFDPLHGRLFGSKSFGWDACKILLFLFLSLYLSQLRWPWNWMEITLTPNLLLVVDMTEPSSFRTKSGSSLVLGEAPSKMFLRFLTLC